MNRWTAIVPLVVLASFAGLAAYQLTDSARSGFERVERAAPARAFQMLDSDGSISFADPPGDDAIVVNLFASWCAPCEVEHPLLVDLSRAAPGRIYGVLYKDSEADGRDFLARLGDPYTAIALDPNGQGGLDFGLTGVPETFVIAPDGMIRMHVRGQLTAHDMDAILAVLTEEKDKETR